MASKSKGKGQNPPAAEFVSRTFFGDDEDDEGYDVYISPDSIRWTDRVGFKTVTAGQYELLHAELKDSLGGIVTLVVDHIIKHPDKKWEYKQLKVRSRMKVNVVSIWRQKIAQVVSLSQEKRAKKLLVIINPTCAGGKSVHLYNEKVAPLFRIAGITPDVIVSESVTHIHQVIDRYDLSSTDGLVAVGGDGTFFHVSNAYYKRLAKSNDTELSNAKVIDLQLPIGIINMGTLGSLGQKTTATTDIVTDALHIASGRKYKSCAMSIQSGKNMFHIGNVVCHLGAVALMQEYMDDLRALGKMKVFMAGIRLMAAFGSLDKNISLSTKSKDGVWTEQKMCMRALACNLMITETDQMKPDVVWLPGCMRIVSATSEFSRLDCMKNFRGLSGLQGQIDATPSLESEDTTECRVTFHDAVNMEKESIMIDGEMFPLKNREIQIRFHKDLVTIFGQGHEDHKLGMGM